MSDNGEHQLTKSETMALLTLRNTYLAKSVIASMRAAGAATSLNDFIMLDRYGLAERRKPDRWHRLTPKGYMHAMILERELAVEHRIPVYERPDVMRRSTLFRSGSMSQSGNS